ncbi:MAG: hypothetical protein ACREOH_18340 [Candidatus Entotheonellia bacterium]
MENITAVLTRAETQRRVRVRQGYRERVGGPQELLPASGEDEWLTRELIQAVQSALRISEPSHLLGLRHLLRFLTEEYLYRHTHTLRDSLIAQQRAAILQVPTVEETVPLWQVNARMAGERKRAARELLEQATTQHIRELTPRYREFWSRLNATVEELGHPHLMAFWEEVSGVRMDDFLKPLEAILRETEDTYREAMDWYLLRTLGRRLSQAKRHDVLALFRFEAVEPWFPASDLIATIQRWLRDWGWDMAEHSNLHLERHPLLPEAAWCAPIEIPQEIRLLLAPIGGMQGAARALHQAGQALLLASFPADAPLELRCFPDPSLLEGQAQVCEGLVRDPLWVEIYRHVRQPAEALRLARVERLFIVRRYIGKCLYERALYEDTLLDGKDEAYVDALRRACGFSYSDAYFLYDVEPGFASFWRLRGWLLGAYLHDRLCRQYTEEWFRQPEALGALLELWYQSPSLTVEALVERVGGPTLDVAPIVADLLRGL